MKNKFASALSLALIMAMLFTSLALADDLSIDNDIVSSGIQATVNLTASTNAPVTTSAQLFVDWQGSKHLTPGSSATFTVSAVQTNLPSGYTVSSVTHIVPTDWNDTNDNFVPGLSSISFTAPSLPGNYSYTVKWDASSFSCLPANNGNPVTDCLSGGNAFTINLSVIDTTPPDTTITAYPANPSSSDSASFAFTGSDNVGVVGFECKLDGLDFAACTSPQPYSGLADGSHTFQVRAKDAAGNIDASPASYTWKIETTPPPPSDTTPPVIAAHADITAEATSAAGAIVFYDAPTTSDDVDGAGVATCVPASGTQFAFGNTTVKCDATDAAGNKATQTSFVVHVVDTTKPTLNLADQSFEGNTTGGYNGAYVGATATDTVDPSPVVACTPASPSFFALGVSTVNCTATDASGNSSQGSFKVTVVDTTKPTLNLPADQSFEGNTTGGYNGAYAGATATDVVDATPTVACTPISGSLLGLGANTINCTATDDTGNSSSDSFTVTVVDTTDPSLTCPADITGIVGQVVVLGSPIAFDIVDASPTVGNNAPASFGPGLTTVVWTATDDSLNSASCSQKVTLTYNFLGFFQPVDNLPMTNSAKAGQSIPFKWALKNASGAFVSDLSVVTSFGFGSGISCGGTTDAIESYDTSGTSGLRYDSLANQFVLSAKSDKLWAGSCKVFFVTLNDGTTHQAKFNFVK